MTTFALLIWPLVLGVMAVRLRWPLAVAAGIVGGYLLLPTVIQFNFPLLPALHKHSIPALTLILLALVLRPGVPRGFAPPVPDPGTVLPGWIPRSASAIVFLLLGLIGGPITAALNGDQQVFGPTVLPGLRLYDGFAQSLAVLTAVLPLFLGRKYFGHPDTHQLLLKVLVVAAVIYTLPALYEIRMSPRLNVMVYGFFPHNWLQHIRAGGFRPVVFLEHGLLLALYFSMAFLAAVGLYRVAGKERRGLYLLAAGWILLTLALSNSLGALVVALLFLPAALLFGVRAQVIFAAAVAAVALTYPTLRSADLVPTERLVEIAATVNEDRARSLNFRFENEDRLLARAQERPIFGWGGFGRHNVFDDRGRDITVAEGGWIIALAIGGWFRFLAEFGLLTLPVILMALRTRSYGITLATSALCVVMAANLIDLLPNAGRTPMTLLIAGALLGRVELGRMAAASPAAAAPESPGQGRGASGPFTPEPGPAAGRPVSAYTRQTRLHRRGAHSEPS